MWLLERLQENYEVPIAVFVGLLCIWYYRRLSKDHGHGETSKAPPKKPSKVTFAEPETKVQSVPTVKASKPSLEKEDKVDNLVTPASLHKAVKLGDVGEVQSLLSRGGDPNIPDRDSNTSYHILFQDISTLPVQDASKVLELLLSSTTDLTGVNSLNREGKTPLHLAVRNTTPDLVRLLLKHGADRSLPDSDGNTPLHTIIEYMQFSQVPAEKEILDLLLQSEDENDNNAKKSGINCLNDEQMTALHQAVMYEEIDNVRALLGKGADPNIPDADGNTPLHTMMSTLDQSKALSAQNKTLLTLLLEAKADVLSENKKGDSPLCMVTNPEIEEEFLKT